jgi:uncharacterized protein YkwD
LRRLILLLAFLLFLFSAWSTFEKWLEKNKLDVTLNSIKTDIDEIRDSPEYIAAVGTIQEGIIQLMDQLDQKRKATETDVNSETEVKKPELSTPSKQSFSIYNIELGDNRSEIEEKMGPPNRSTYNEYGLMWNSYHENFQRFMMISYDENDQVVALYTPHDLISSTYDIKRGSTKATVLEKLGTPIDKIRKGMTYYQFEKDRDYDVFLVDGSYITVFYDQHQSDTVTSIQIISEETEKRKKDFYTASSESLKEGFEYQLFDLTNATRVNHNLPVLTWDDHVRETARKHSLDMAENKYFSHTNLDGQSPFDRMLEDDILFSVAGENLAYGQFSSIFAHEGLMNSMGHRENILQPDFRNLGVGVAFNEKSQPYYTAKLYTR